MRALVILVLAMLLAACNGDRMKQSQTAPQELTIGRLTSPSA